MSTITDVPTGCGCAACQAAAKADLSSNYIGAASATLSEANSLYSGYRWGTGTNGITLSYKFFTALPGYYSSGMDETKNFQAFNSQMKSATERVLDQLESFTKITFVETSSNSTQLGFAQASLPAGVGAWAYYPSSNSLGGDVWTNNIYSQTQAPAEGNYGFYTLLHEIGHALGLQHSFTAGLTGDEASSRYSVMAYDWSPFFASSYMVYDIAALQKIYGANMSWHTGNDNYVTDKNLAYTIWDAGGNDTLDASAQTSAVTLDLREGEYSSVGLTRNIGIAFGAVIENATGGTGNDIIIGNGANNNLIGLDGNDVFIASQGIDDINGSNGTDTLVFDNLVGNFYLTLLDSVTISLRDISGTYGTTTAHNIENFTFGASSFSFAALAATVSSSIDIIEDITLSISSSMKVKGKTKKFTTDIVSDSEGVTDYYASDFRYNNSSNVMSVVRDSNSGHDSLHVIVRSGYESYPQNITIRNLEDLDEIGFTRASSVVVNDITTTHDLSVTLDGVYYAYLNIGSGNDDVDIISTASGKTVAAYDVSTGEGDDQVTLRASNGANKVSASITGGDGNDALTVEGGASATLSGGNGDDVLTGGNKADTLVGGAGNDILIGGNGYDVLYGGAGSDIFVFDSTSLAYAEDLKDFNAAEDVIDISALLTGYDPVSEAIADFVRIVTAKKGTYLQVDMDGADNGSNYTIIAGVTGLKGQNIDDLIANDHLIVA